MTSTGARILALCAQVRAADPSSPVPSPCNSVCRMNERSGLCEGCLRTLDEIASWSQLPQEDKRAVWERLSQRALTPSEPAL